MTQQERGDDVAVARLTILLMVLLAQVAAVTATTTPPLVALLSFVALILAFTGLLAVIGHRR